MLPESSIVSMMFGLDQAHSLHRNFGERLLP
jgi:hypothetical protein